MIRNTTIADRYADAKLRLDAIQAEVDALKAEILATGRDSLIGDHFAVLVGLEERSSLDQKAVKTILTPAQIAACSKTQLITKVRFKAIVAEIA